MQTPPLPSDNRHNQLQRQIAQPETDGQSNYLEKEKQRILAAYGSNESFSDEEVEDPNLEYALIKMKLDRLEVIRRRNKDVDVDPAQMAKLQSRLETMKSHYFFKMRDAQALYQEEKRKAHLAALKEKLEGKPSEPDFPVPVPDDSPQPPVQLAETPTDSSKEDEAEKSEDEGGMFGTLLDTMPEFEERDGVQVRIRDMALPKHWGGRTPKTLLLETVQKVDRQAIITYRTLPDVRTSRAKRSAVTVRWEGTRSGEWCMDEVGCYDEAQAEQYISTIALHDLTFGHSEGFAGGPNALSFGSGQTYFRLLPPVFRDLWDELEIKRKEEEDRRNRETWATLRQIIEGKLGEEKKVTIFIHERFEIFLTRKSSVLRRFRNLCRPSSRPPGIDQIPQIL